MSGIKQDELMKHLGMLQALAKSQLCGADGKQHSPDTWAGSKVKQPESVEHEDGAVTEDARPNGAPKSAPSGTDYKAKKAMEQLIRDLQKAEDSPEDDDDEHEEEEEEHEEEEREEEDRKKHDAEKSFAAAFTKGLEDILSGGGTPEPKEPVEGGYDAEAAAKEKAAKEKAAKEKAEKKKEEEEKRAEEEAGAGRDGAPAGGSPAIGMPQGGSPMANSMDVSAFLAELENITQKSLDILVTQTVKSLRYIQEEDGQVGKGLAESLVGIGSSMSKGLSIIDMGVSEPASGPRTINKSMSDGAPSTMDAGVYKAQVMDRGLYLMQKGVANLTNMDLLKADSSQEGLEALAQKIDVIEKSLNS